MSLTNVNNSYPEKKGLYDSVNEHDSCGVGFVANIDGTRTHKIIEQGIEVLVKLLHRGAVGGDANTGDGAGILSQIPDEFFRKVMIAQNTELPPAGQYGVGMVFLPVDQKVSKKCIAAIEKSVKSEGLEVLGWRDVPTDDSSLGKLAKDTQPVVKQVFIGRKKEGLDIDAFERKLYVIRRLAGKIVSEIPGSEEPFYITSMSCRTIVYKGLLVGTQLPLYYPDLTDKDFKSALALIHQRYSTNTFPTWPLAQPFRYLAHNGEINTLRGNINQMKAREKNFESDLFGEDIKKLLPIIQENQSDSACLDNALELFNSCGRSLPHSMMMLIPQAWGEKYRLSHDLKGFYEFHAGLMEPWDGPAAVAFSDGKSIGAMLDRNGLRPARYTITTDNFMVLASETGVLDIPTNKVHKKGRLRPGQMIFVDLDKKRVMFDSEIKAHVARRQPYRRWVEENKILLQGLFDSIVPVKVDEATLLEREMLFGYNREDVNIILQEMAETGHEPIGSMGNDAALAILSEKPQLLFAYFKQLFAQVTNPPIDSIREELVMSLTTFLGNCGNVLKETPQHAHLVKLKNPILTNEDLERLRISQLPSFQSVTLKISFPSGGDAKELETAIDKLCVEAEESVRRGKALLVLSDKNLPKEKSPIPSLLAVSAVNHHLIRSGLRTNTSIVIETGEAREVMHFALLLGYGATAVNPYLALEVVGNMVNKGFIQKVDVTAAMENYITSICKGLLKVMSKMGISTLRSYRGAQIFEAVGLNKHVIDKYFTATSSRISGIGLDVIAKEANSRYAKAYRPKQGSMRILDAGGQYMFRQGEEKHLWTPETIMKLQQATKINDYQLYKQYASLINHQEKHLCTLRGLFKFKKVKSIPLAEVEPASEIVKRFVTGAMSFGSISKEAHETLAIAMNRLGGMSNSGEGGEDPARYKLLPNGDSLCSAIKQIASGRFGVTIEYLANARELQIKIAQGAKPGEGGQLPGHKVNKVIARVRHSTPGVTLISPPPHHDIYSIEDLKQLIYDLKNSNPSARISVKLVSEVGVGTIAAGVAKAHADMVLISGHDGGTGASPLSSIKHAGLPWELGLAETQQTLVLNHLRDKIRVQADGQMKTGRDVVIGAMLGAEEFGFATGALVVCGCVMMRKCHKNTCPVGIATQDPELRKRYNGKPEHVINFFMMIAEEIREYLAELGFKKLEDIIGRSDFLEMNDAIDFWKTKNLDFSAIFARPYDNSMPVRCLKKQDHEMEKTYDMKIIEKVRKSIETKKPIELDLPICNVDRTVGTMTSHEIAKRYGNAGLADDTIKLTFRGCAGQSFGAFLAHGITFTLIGESNDYLGKGLSGGKIIVKPPEKITYDPSENTIAGNVLLYGATSGEVYINGQVGERFAIRNSGAHAVIEGAGDHCCEYMTGGRIVVLGSVGVNFAAGMSGGLAYVFDKDNTFDEFCNLDMVDLEQVVLSEDIFELKTIIENHYRITGSKKAEQILNDWENCLPLFVKVFPMEYRKVLGQMMKEDEEIQRVVKQE
ncbi:MAG: glutamate synthase subunit alpha [Lentisphaerae bacterium GWF2_50_93]|nr:MAG: glutamate synthase subunit alpha [Lentisphaerae bacterium GWF2_50_93]